jgi:hypothetical protein
MYQGEVEHHHWLSAIQMIDGFALGETVKLRRTVDYDCGLFYFFAGLSIYCGLLVESTHSNLKFTAPLSN